MITAKEYLKLLQEPGRHLDGNGLYLQIRKPGSGSWI